MNQTQASSSLLLTISSIILFGSATILFIYKRGIKSPEAILTAWLTLTSVLYHSTGNPIAKRVDLVGNLVIAPTMAIYAYKTLNKGPYAILAALAALLGYLIATFDMKTDGAQKIKEDSAHLVLVHIPVFIGLVFCM